MTKKSEFADHSHETAIVQSVLVVDRRLTVAGGGIDEHKLKLGKRAVSLASGQT